MTCRCKTVKVHRDFHIEVAKALYSIPKVYIGQHVDVRADSTLVKVFHCGPLIKVNPRQRPGRAVDPSGRPARAQGRLRDTGPGPARRRRPAPRARCGHLRRTAARGRPAVDEDAAGLPAARPRRPYGDEPVNTACGKALEVDVVFVTKIASILEK